MRLSVVFVNYRAAGLLVRALDSWQSDARAAGLADVEWIVVDNGDDDLGRRRLDALAAAGEVRLIRPEANLGYAGGANLGLAQAGGEVLAVANPDLEISPGATAALLAVVTCQGSAIVGPRFVWDRGGTLLLPPAERRTPRDELADLVASRGPSGAWIARRRWRRHARRHWEAAEPFASLELSGALLVFDRAAWQRTGPFDTGYPLYFEETDWLLRAGSLGLGVFHVPTARVLHLHGASSRQEPAAADWFTASAARFRTRHYGKRFAADLARMAQLVAAAADGQAATDQPERLAPKQRRGRLGPPPGRPGGARPPAAGGSAEPLAPGWHRRRERAIVGKSGAGPAAGSAAGSDRWWIELSPRAQGFPAVGQALEAPPAADWPFAVPADVRPRLGAGPWHLRLIDPAGEERAVRVLDLRALEGGES